MNDSKFSSKKFIPVYFIVGILNFLLFRFYIQTDNFSVYLLTILLIVLGLASIIYNSKNKNEKD